MYRSSRTSTLYHTCTSTPTRPAAALTNRWLHVSRLQTLHSPAHGVPMKQIHGQFVSPCSWCPGDVKHVTTALHNAIPESGTDQEPMTLLSTPRHEEYAGARIVADVIRRRQKQGAHIPVMPEEVLNLWVAPNANARYFIDATAGHGGHAEMILRLYPEAHVLCVDRDPQVLAYARRLISQSDETLLERAYFYRGSFANLKEAIELTKFPAHKVDGIFFDLGLNSSHIDSAERGFSYRQDGRLDMRYNPDLPKTQAPPAQDLLYYITYPELREILRERGQIEDYGDEIAAAIVRWRGKGSKRRKIRSTLELRFVVESAIETAQQQNNRRIHTSSGRQQMHVTSEAFTEKAKYWNSKASLEKSLSQMRKTKPKYPLTIQKVFQALRLAVNNEEFHIVTGLSVAPNLLNPGGRLVCMSFSPHEDLFAQNLFRALNEDESNWNELTATVTLRDTIGATHHKQAPFLRPRRTEVRHNSRARSAHLRGIEKSGTNSVYEDNPVELTKLSAMKFVDSEAQCVQGGGHSDGVVQQPSKRLEYWSEDEKGILLGMQQELEDNKLRIVLEDDQIGGHSKKTPNRQKPFAHMPKVQTAPRDGTKRQYSTSAGRAKENTDDEFGLLDSLIDETIDSKHLSGDGSAEQNEVEKVKEALQQSQELRHRYKAMVGNTEMEVDDNTLEYLKKFSEKMGIDMDRPDLERLGKMLEVTGVSEDEQTQAWEGVSEEITNILQHRAQKELGLSPSEFETLLSSFEEPGKKERLLEALEKDVAALKKRRNNSQTYFHHFDASGILHNDRESLETARQLAGKLANVDAPSHEQMETELPYMRKLMAKADIMELPKAFTDAGITLDNLHKFSEEDIENKVFNKVTNDDPEIGGVTWDEAIGKETVGQDAKLSQGSSSVQIDDSSIKWKWDAEHDEQWLQRQLATKYKDKNGSK